MIVADSLRKLNPRLDKPRNFEHDENSHCGARKIHFLPSSVTRIRLTPMQQFRSPAMLLLLAVSSPWCLPPLAPAKAM